MTKRFTFSRRQSSLDVSAEAINEISSEVTKLVFDYFTGVSRLPVLRRTGAGKQQMK